MVPRRRAGRLRHSDHSLLFIVEASRGHADSVAEQRSILRGGVLDPLRIWKARFLDTDNRQNECLKLYTIADLVVVASLLLARSCTDDP